MVKIGASEWKHLEFVSSIPTLAETNKEYLL